MNYGFAASWALARMEAVAGVSSWAAAWHLSGNIAGPGWQRSGRPAQIGRILDRLAADLADGALGIGILVGYSPGADPAEYLRSRRSPRRAGVPTFTHARDLIESSPQTLIDGAEEIVRAAAETGAHMHYCHININIAAARRPGARRWSGGHRRRVAGHDRGLPVRLGDDRRSARPSSPRSGYQNGVSPRPTSPTRRPVSRCRRGAAARAARHRSRRPGDHQAPRRGRSGRRERDAAVADLPGRGRGQRRDAADLVGAAAGQADLAAAGERVHSSAYRGDVRPRVADAATGGDGGPVGTQLGLMRPCGGAACGRPVAGRPRPRNASQGTDAPRLRCGPRGLRPGGDLRPGDLPPQHPPVGRIQPRPGQRHVRGPGRGLVTDALPGQPVRAPR